MEKYFRKVKITNYYKQKRKKREFYLSIYNDKLPISIKSLIIIFLSISFIYIQLIRKSFNKIHVAVNMDNRYIYCCIVFLTSLLKNRAESTFYIIHILTNKTSLESMNKINNIIEKFGNNSSKVIYYNLGDDFKGASIKGFALSVYYRIAAPSVLSNIDKLIYSDIDIINLKDLSEMYNIKFQKDMYICAVLDEQKYKKELDKFGINLDKYINAGILLMDLKTMRENKVEKKLRDFIATHTLDLCDQAAINAICHDNIQIISYKYNLYPINSYNNLVKINNEQNPKYRFNESELYPAYHEPTFVHFYGDAKPWYKPNYFPYIIYWWYYAKLSGFYNEILNYYKTDINYVENLLKKIPGDGGLLKGKYKKIID